MAVAIVRVELLVCGADLVEQGVAGFGRTDIVLQPDIDDDRAGDLVGEVDAIKVGQGVLYRWPTIRMLTQIVVDLLIGIGMGERR